MSLPAESHVSGPYPGLRPFRHDEALVFFGRDEQIDDVLKRLKENQFLSIVGASGCGKSSLIRAGVLPALESGLMGELGSTWFVVDMKPGDAPITNLARALVQSGLFGDRWSDSPAGIALLTATLRRSDVSLLNLVKQIELPRYTNILILADQFEEIFRFQQLDPNEALAFVNLLLATAFDRSVSTYVVLTMRSDFLGQCATFPGLPEALNDGQYLCPRLTRDQLAEAIEGPASVFGAMVERPLVNQLINDAGVNSDQLPLVQHVLARMWNLQAGTSAAASADATINAGAASNVNLQLADYSACGGMFGVRTRTAATSAETAQSNDGPFEAAAESECRAVTADDQQNALSRHVDEAYFELADPSQHENQTGQSAPQESPRQWVAQMLFRSLAERSVTGQYVRRPMKVEAVAEVVKEPSETIDAAVARVIDVVDVFRREDRSFLVPPAGVTLSKDSVLDISHEALIRQWRRLAGDTGQEPNIVDAQTGWLATEERARRRYRRIFEAAEAESTSGLMRDPELSFLNAWWQEFQPRRGWANSVRPGSFDRTETYLNTSLEAARREAADRKRALEHVLNLERDRLESTRRMLKYAGGIAVVAFALAFFTWRLKIAADDAKGRAVVAQAEAQAEKIKADKAAELAEKSAGEASDARELAVTELDRSEHLLYESKLRLAQDEFTSGNFDRALQKLDRCRWDYRGWEHHSLASALRRLRSHTAPVTSVSFSPDGTQFVSASEDRTLKVWDSRTGAELVTLKGHTGRITSAWFSPDGHQIVSGSNDTTLRLWNARTGAELMTLSGHKDCVRSVCYGPQSLIVSGSNDNTIKVWSATTGTELRTIKGHTGVVSCVRLSPDGTRIVSGSFDRTLRVWDTATGSECLPKKEHSDPVWCVDFSRDGKNIVSGCDDGSLKIWDVATGRELLTVKQQGGPVWSAAFSGDGKRIVTGNSDNSLKVWDAVNGARLMTLLGHTEAVNSVSFSLDGRQIVSGSDDHTVRILEAVEEPRCRTFGGDSDRIICIGFNPAGDRIVSGSADRMVQIWNVQTGTAEKKLAGHTEAVNSVSFNRAGDRIVSGSADTMVKIWDAQTGRELQTLTGHTDMVNSVGFSRDGLQVVSGSKDTMVKIWDAQTGRELQTLTGHTDMVNSVSFSRDGQRVVSGSEDTTVRIWSVQTGKEIQTLTGNRSAVSSVSFSPDDRRVIIGCKSAKKSNPTGEGHEAEKDGGTVKVWDLLSDGEPMTLLGHTTDVTSSSISPDGLRIVSGSNDATLKLWNSRTGTEFLTLRSSNGKSRTGVTSVCFSSDGARFASSDERTISVWEPACTREMLPVDASNDKVTRVVLTGDNQWIATGDSDGKVQVWNAKSGQPGRQLSGHTESITALAFHPHVPAVVSGSTDKTIRFWMMNDESGKLTLSPKQPEPISLEGEVAWTIAFSSDGRLVAVGSNHGKVRIIDVTTREMNPTISAHGSLVKGLEFSSDNTEMITAGWVAGGETSEIKVWNVATGKQVTSTTSIPYAMSGFARHGDRVAVGSKTGSIQVWNLRTGAALSPLVMAHDNFVHDVEFSPDGMLLASASDDKTIILWECRPEEGGLTLTQARTLTEHTAPVNSVTFSHGGTRLVSGSNDGTARVWLLKELLPLHMWEPAVKLGGEHGSMSASNPAAEGDPLNQPEVTSAPSMPIIARAGVVRHRISTLEKFVLLSFVLFAAVVAVAGQQRRRHGRA